LLAASCTWVARITPIDVDSEQDECVIGSQLTNEDCRCYRPPVAESCV